MSEPREPTDREELVDLLAELGQWTAEQREQASKALENFALPRTQQAIANATYRGAGFVIHDEQGYDRELAKASVGPGWAGLIDRAFDAKPEGVRVVQVKEKYAGLRIYTSGIDDAFDDLLFELENESLRTCERCGQPGLVRKGGWQLTLCDLHADGRPGEDVQWTRGNAVESPE